MDKDKKKLMIFGTGNGGGGGAATWGSITGTLSNQTDLQNALNAKADSSSVPTSTSDLTNDSGFRTVVEINDMTQAELLDFYTNYATLMTQNTYVVDGHEAVATTMQIQPYGTVLILESNVRYKNEFAGAPAGTIDALGTATYIFADGSKQSDNLTFNFPETSGLATVATSGSYNDLTNTPTIPAAQIQSDWNQSDNTQLDFIKNKPTIPAAVSGTNDGTNWTSLTVGTDTYAIPSGGGGGNDWYGSKEMFDSIPESELDDDTNYYISDNIDYSDISNTPYIPTKVSDLTNDSNFVTLQMLDLSVYNTKKEIDDSFIFCTQTEYDTMSLAGTLEPDKKYFIQGTQNKLEMVVTFTDTTTATYNVYVE